MPQVRPSNIEDSRTQLAVCVCSCRQVTVVKGSCTIQCNSVDGRNNTKDLLLKQGDTIVLEAGQGGVVLNYSATTTEAATVIATQ